MNEEFNQEQSIEQKILEIKDNNISMLIAYYLKDKSELRDENDSVNIDKGTIIRWDFKNIPQPTIEELHSLINPLTQKIKQEQINIEAKAFLDATDFKVLRHIRQKALGQQLSLSEEEYLHLEQQRSDAAASIIK